MGRTTPVIAGFEARGMGHGPRNSDDLQELRKQRKGFYSERYSPANTLILVSWDLSQNYRTQVALQNSKMIKF